MKIAMILLLIIMTAFLSTEVFGSDLTISTASAAGEADGKEDARIILGFVAGLTLNVIGVGVGYTLPINLNHEREWWINEQTDNPTVITAYTEAYVKAYRKALVTSAWLGCGASVVAYMLFIFVIIKGLTNWG